MAPDVTFAECFRLARAMTLKNAAAGLPHGGGKSVIIGDPKMPADRKEIILRAFARALGDIHDYIMGPDMGTDERAMAWVHDETGRSVGLPRVIGGIPLDEIGATGFGIAIAAEAAQEFGAIKLSGARIAVQGFGAVGKFAARFLAERGAVLVAASDSSGTIANPRGLDVAALIALKGRGASVSSFAGGAQLGRDAIVSVDCDIWIPAARPDVITMANVDSLRTKLILQGANIPATAEAEQRLLKRGILCLPDFIVNAGGVICAAVEHQGGTQSAAFAAIAEKIRTNTHAVLEAARRRNVAPRQAALDLAHERIHEAMSYQRF